MSTTQLPASSLQLPASNFLPTSNFNLPLQTSKFRIQTFFDYSSPVPHGRSPTPGLLVGLVLTLAAVVTYTLYINRQITSLRVLQSEMVDRNRRDSLQLLRIQNNLNQLGLAMRDMLQRRRTSP